MIFLAHQLTNSLAHYTSFIYTGGAAAHLHPLNLVNLLNPLNLVNLLNPLNLVNLLNPLNPETASR